MAKFTNAELIAAQIDSIVLAREQVAADVASYYGRLKVARKNLEEFGAAPEELAKLDDPELEHVIQWARGAFFPTTVGT